MLRIGDKVTIQTDDAFEKKKHLLNGHICVITDIIDRTHLFPSMDPQLHIIYGIYWFPEDNPGRWKPDALNDYYYMENEVIAVAGVYPSAITAQIRSLPDI